MRDPEQPSPPATDASRTNLAIALRHATAAAHELVEQLPIMLRLTSQAVTGDDYRHYLRILGGIYATLESSLYNGLDATTRERLGVSPKLPALLRDLEEQENMAGQAMTVPPLLDVPNDVELRGPSAIVGGFYVLEGATLGGRTIARHLRRILGDELGAASFLDFHGEQTSTVWKHFSGALNDLCSDGTLTPEEVIAGALATFDYVHGRLARGDPPPRSAEDPQAG